MRTLVENHLVPLTERRQYLEVLAAKMRALLANTVSARTQRGYGMTTGQCETNIRNRGDRW